MKTVRVFKVSRMLLRAVRILRLLRLPRIMQRIEQLMSRAVINLVQFLVATVLVCHFSACLFYWSG